ncbi:DUF4339 domain-containing protein [Geothrix campi]|uniref:DUF4339 domain-containing protein n=1 Tax=Geothrix campi TaxID=2966450 RepID=UPI0021471FFE|nr:DUF4339 domain-containing protein [Geothrix sp. SG10]
MATQWKYIQQGQAMGPVSEDQVKALLASGSLGWDDLVWREGMPDWTTARMAPDLAQGPAPIGLDLPPVPAAPQNPFSPPRAALLEAQWGGAPVDGVSADVVEVLRQTKPWARLLGVLGFIGIGFMLLASVAMLAVGSFARGGMPAGLGVGMMLAYLAMAGLQFPAALFLNRYASRIGDLVANPSQGDLQEALAAQKSFWRYVGILTLLFMCLYIAGIAIAIAVATVFRAGH